MSTSKHLRQTALAIGIASALSIPVAAHSGDATGLGASATKPAAAANTESAAKQARTGPDRASTATDRALNQRIRETLRGDRELASLTTNVRLDIDNGTVTLMGTVATEQDKNTVASKIERIAGVKKINNELQLAPTM